MEDAVALNLLYVEAREAIRARVIQVTDEAKVALKTHQGSGDKRAFVEMCQVHDDTLFFVFCIFLF